MGADLRLYEIASGTDRAIPIALASDFDHLRERWIKNPDDYTTSVHLSPDGSQRGADVARTCVRGASEGPVCGCVGA